MQQRDTAKQQQGVKKGSIYCHKTGNFPGIWSEGTDLHDVAVSIVVHPFVTGDAAQHGDGRVTETRRRQVACPRHGVLHVLVRRECEK